MKKYKRIVALLLSCVMAFSVLSATGIQALAANSINTSFSVKAFVKNYTAKVSANVTSTKLTASTYYESTAKELATIGVAVRTDKDSNGNYRMESTESTKYNVSGQTASVTITASSSQRYRGAVTTHYVKTTSDELAKTYNLYV